MWIVKGSPLNLPPLWSGDNNDNYFLQLTRAWGCSPGAPVFSPYHLSSSYNMVHFYLVVAQRGDSRMPKSSKFWACASGRILEPLNLASSGHAETFNYLSEVTMEKHLTKVNCLRLYK